MQKTRVQIYRRAVSTGLVLLVGTLALLASLANGSPSSPAPVYAQPADGAGTATPLPTCLPGWQLVNSPDPGGGLSFLYDVAVIAPDDAWAVGQYSTSFGVNESLILHWNGTAWSLVPDVMVDDSGLYAISAIGPQDIWAVGYYNPDPFSPYQPLAVHWDGATWSIATPPADPQYETTLQGVGGAAPNDVWAVGENESGPLIMHWNGSAWAIVPHPLQHVPTPGAAAKTSRPSLYWDTLYAVGVVSANDVWAVGARGDNSLALHWDGMQWAAENTPNPYSTDILRGITVLATNDIWAVGSTDFYMGQPRAITFHWNGQTWANVPTVAGDLVLNDVAALAGNDLWAVGYEQVTQYNTAAVLLHRSGGQWVRVPGPNPTPQNLDELYGIAASGPTRAWAVGTFDGETLIDRYTACGPPEPTQTPTYLPTATPTQLPTYTPGATNTPTSPTPCPITFTDVDSSNPFYPYVRCLACRGIVGGYTTSPPCGAPPGPGVPCFLPGANVTRGQIAKFVSNAANYQDAIPSTRQTFSDVPYGSPFWLYVERAAMHGVISGYTTSPPCVMGVPCFLPGNDVTRGQVAKFVSNAASYQDAIPSARQTFADVPPGNAFWVYIERTALHGVISGYTSSPPCVMGVPCFLPGTNVTRGQTAKFIANAFFPNCPTPRLLKTQ